MIARFAIGTFSSVLEDLLTVTSYLFMPLHALLPLLPLLHASTSKMLWIGLLRTTFVVLDRFACLSYSGTFFAVRRRNAGCAVGELFAHERRRIFGGGKARAKQGQSKSKGLEFDIVRSKRCYNGQLISADIS